MSEVDPIAIKFVTSADTAGAAQTSAAVNAVKDSTSGVASAAAGAVTPVKAMATEIKAGGEEHASYHEKQKLTIEGLHMVAMMSGGEMKEGLHEGGLAIKMLGGLTGEMSMGIVGGALAIGQAIPMIVGYFKEAYTKAQEEAMKWSEEETKVLEKAAGEYGNLIATRMEDDHKEAVAKISNEATLATSYRDADKAQSAASIAALDNAAKLEQAEKLIAQALGIRIDKYKEIQILAGIEAAKIQETAKEAEADGSAKMKTAVVAAMKQTETIALRATELRQNKELLEVEEKRLETLDKQRTEMEMAQEARKKKSFDPVGAANSAGYPGELGGVNLMIAGAKSAVKTYRENVKTLEQASLTDDANFEDLIKKITDAESARKTQDATISATLAADTSLADAKQVGAEIKENLADMAAVTGNVTQTTAMERGALIALQGMQSGQTLTVQQIPIAVQALQQLAGSIQLGFATVHGTTADAVVAINSLQRQLESQRQDMIRLKAQVGMR